MDDPQLRNVISSALVKLEEDGEIVLCSSADGPISRRIAEAVSAVTPHSELSLEEMYGVRSLILHAIAYERFFDWEMPTLTGFTAEQFRGIAEKFPRD